MRFGGALVVGFLVVGLSVGCGGGSKPTTPQCVLNSDCAKLSTPGLICALGYCVTPCKVSSDCPNSERCVIVTSTGADAGDAGGTAGADGGGAQGTGTACQAPETVSCAYNHQCATPLVCGDDHQCRDQCLVNVDCPTAQVCTSVTHLCADPSIDKDYNSTINDFVVDGGAGGAQGGAGGGAGKGGGGGNHDAGAGGAGTDASTTPINGDPCVAVDGGFAPESTPNNDPQHATALPLGTPYRGCLQTATDVDYFQFSVPTSSVQGGWLTIVASQVAGGLRVTNALATASDNALIVNQSGLNPGANAAVYAAGKPGVQFLVQIQSLNLDSGSGAYTLTASFQDDSETGEPNNIRSQATPLTVGTSFNGKFFAGYSSGVAPTAVDWADWFSVALTPGTFTIKLTNAPADITSEMYFYDPQGAELSLNLSGTPGADLIITTPAIATAGTYFVSTTPYSLPPASGGGATLPMWATGTYTLTVAPSP
jgi:hypothetical protein